MLRTYGVDPYWQLLFFLFTAALMGVVFIFLRRFDRRRSLQEYLVSDLEASGFKYISSSYHKKRSTLSGRPSPMLEDENFIRDYYKVYRTVTFLDANGYQKRALAAIQFDNFFIRTFEKVIWEPDLKTFKKP